ncbi:MAG: hypothetical protein JXR51_01790 [Bacteroidales bacterium]|nr:hypothetical protein [Bacteroidales bacterium]
METEKLQKEKEIKTKLFWAIGLATLALLFTFFKLPFDFILALIAYIIVGIALVKKDGALGIFQVILVFPAIFTAYSDFFSGDNNINAADDGINTKKLDKLTDFTLFYTAIVIIVTILFPIIRFFWNLFT